MASETGSLPTLAVTGSTGALGGSVAREVAAGGLSQRLLARRPDRAPSLANAIPLPCSYQDAVAATAALQGVRILFMVSASESADRLEVQRRFVASAAAAGVEHLVYTSFYGAAPDATFTLARTHADTEEFIRASGMAYTFLRDNFYLDVFAHFVGADGVLRGPGGSGRVAAVARADVARVAAAILASPERHRGATYDLTGPQSLTLAEIAATIGSATGREVSYHDETLEEAYESRRAWDAPDWQYDAWVSTYTAIASGELASVTDQVERLSGRAPRSLADLLRA